MTTRADLLSEREALRGLLGLCGPSGRSHDALTASIARLDALLSLSDEQVQTVFGVLTEAAGRIARMSWQGSGAEDRAYREAALRTVAEIVRRTS